MNLKLSLEKAKEAYKKATAENKQLLVDLYGSHFFEEVKDRLKGYASACEILNRAPLTIEAFKFLGEKQAKKQFARHRIVTCIEALNQGWEPDFDNSNQYKYYVWMYGKKNGFTSVVLGFSVTTVGSDMYCETRENIQLIEKICKQDYIEYLF